MTEPVADMYYEKLQNGDNPIVVIVNLCKALFGIVPDKSFYGQIGRLINIYGVRIVFFAVLDCADIEVRTDSMIRLISFFCKKRFERKFEVRPVIDLTKRAREIEKSLEKNGQKEINH